MGVYPEVLKAGTQKDVCIPTFIAASFIIAKRSIGRWIDNNVYTDMTEHQPALEKEGHSDMGYDIDEAWGHDAEISQTQQIKHCTGTSSHQIHRKRGEGGRCKNRERKGSCCLTGADLQFCQMKRGLQVGDGDGRRMTWRFITLLCAVDLKVVKMLHVMCTWSQLKKI